MVENGNTRKTVFKARVSRITKGNGQDNKLTEI